MKATSVLDVSMQRRIRVGRALRLLLLVAIVGSAATRAKCENVTISPTGQDSLRLVSLGPAPGVLEVGFTTELPTGAMPRASDPPLFHLARTFKLTSEGYLQTDGGKLYLSGDFSVDPPRVILTKKPNGHSTWTLVPAKSGGDYLKISTAQADTWLDLNSKPQAFNREKGELLIYPAILSTKTKRAFDVDEASK